MLTVRRSDDRGRFDFGWLDTRHTFSFGDYHDPAHMGFRSLRVINEDIVAPAKGFDTHPHRDMEIITYVVRGELAHKDSTGGEGVIRPGDVQRMSAGSGVLHSEFNPSRTEPVHLLQIWIRPAIRSVAPRYDQKHFPPDARADRLRLVISPDGADGSIEIHQDARLYASLLGKGGRVAHAFAPGRHAWLQLISGSLDVNGQRLGPGDAVAASDERELSIAATEPAEFLLFDLA